MQIGRAAAALITLRIAVATKLRSSALFRTALIEAGGRQELMSRSEGLSVVDPGEALLIRIQSSVEASASASARLGDS